MTRDVQPARMTASIVIPSWNGWPILSRNLPHVIDAAGGTQGTEIIVSDDGSRDGTADHIARTFPGVRCLAREVNGGFGVAANAGAAAARGTFVVCLNNDVRPSPGFLDPLLEALSSDPTLFAAAAKMIHAGFGGDEARTAAVFRRGLIDVTFPDRGADTSPSGGITPILYACGGGAAFRRDRFLELGGFDPLFHPFYWEDVDLSWRARRRGWGIVHVPGAVLHHEGGSTIGRRFPRREVAVTYERNRLLFIWSNLIAPPLWRRHLAWLLPRAVHSAARLDPLSAGLARAIRRLPQAMKRRRGERARAAVPDEEILASGGGVVGPGA